MTVMPFNNLRLCLLNRSSNRGNFLELLQWASATDPVALAVLEDNGKNATYLSPTIQNEIISLLAAHVRSRIAGKVRST
jgi:Domain of unknown function (DUF4371)